MIKVGVIMKKLIQQVVITILKVIASILGIHLVLPALIPLGIIYGLIVLIIFLSPFELDRYFYSYTV